MLLDVSNLTIQYSKNIEATVKNIIFLWIEEKF